MLVLAADLHQSQITYQVSDETGNVLQRGQVGTKPHRVDELISRLMKMAAGELVVGFEECGFGHWFYQTLQAHGCRAVVKIQPLKKQPHKTDKRDAAAIGEILLVNLARILDGRPLLGVRRVDPPTEELRQARVVCIERQNLMSHRHEVICNVKDIVRRFNLQHHCPTKGLFSKRGRRWLEQLELPEAERRALDRLLRRLDFVEAQIDEVDADIKTRAKANAACAVVQTIHGAGGLTALGMVARIGSIDRFPRPSSLANLFGLTPGQNDSGDRTGRVGNITKRGNSFVRFLLGQMVKHVIGRDKRLRKWHAAIKKRRGAKIALVAMMRKIITIIWHMLKTGETYESVRSRMAT